MSEYELVFYVRPWHLDWTLEGVKLYTNKYGINLHSISIGKQNRRNPYHKEANEVRLIISASNKRVIPYLVKRLEKEIGILK